MEDREIKEIIDSAISMVRGEKRPLQSGSSERAFSHRLAVYLEEPFRGWDVDCEYNRQGIFTKELEGIAECDERRRTDRIYPDIIVHHRTNDNEPIAGENLLVIELKNDNAEDVCDRSKLELFTSPNGHYRYQLGLYINVGNHEFNKTWYKNGKQIAEESILA